jgi:hypothetical protein
MMKGSRQMETARVRGDLGALRNTCERLRGELRGAVLASAQAAEVRAFIAYTHSPRRSYVRNPKSSGSGSKRQSVQS